MSARQAGAKALAAVLVAEWLAAIAEVDGDRDTSVAEVPGARIGWHLKIDQPSTAVAGTTAVSDRRLSAARGESEADHGEGDAHGRYVRGHGRGGYTSYPRPCYGRRVAPHRREVCRAGPLLPRGSVTAKSKRLLLASIQTLTGSDAVLSTGGGAASGVFDVRSNAEVTFEVAYTKGGSATALEVVVESALLASPAIGDWTPHEVVLDLSASITAGVATVTAGTQRRSYTTTGRYMIHLRTYGAHRMRIKAKETGTPGGTVTVYATGAQETP